VTAFDPAAATTVCEICGEQDEAGCQTGCRWCGKMFHACCDSVEDDVCAVCIEIHGPSEEWLADGEVATREAEDARMP